jgi:hypothetical protein
MLDLALEDLQRATIQGRELLQRHPDRAHAALDLLLLNIGCWEVRWLGVTHAPEGAGANRDMELADEDGVSTFELEQAAEMSNRARDLMPAPSSLASGQASRHPRGFQSQVTHARGGEIASHAGD